MEYLPVGIITKTVGLKGHLRLIAHGEIINLITLPASLIGIPGQFLEKNFLQSIIQTLPEKIIKIQINEIFNTGKNYIYKLQLDDIHSKDDAEKYINVGLFISMEEIPRLDESEIYLYQLLDLIVIRRESNVVVGKIESVIDFGAQPNLNIVFNDTFIQETREQKNISLSKNVQIPYVRKYIHKIDIADKYIILNDMDDFLFL